MENFNAETSSDGLNGQSVLCLSCFKPNDGAAVFCRYCNAALALTNNSDHLQRIAGEGAVYSKAVEGKPKPVVLIGVWLLFFPLLILCGMSAIALAFGNEGGSVPFLMFWVSAIGAFFSLTMLYKVTGNYFKNDDGKNQ